MVFMPVAMKDSLDVFLELAGAGVWDGGIMAQDTAFESTCWVTFHTEPVACLLGSDLLQLLSARTLDHQADCLGPLLSLVKCFLPFILRRYSSTSPGSCVPKSCSDFSTNLRLTLL